MSIRKGSSIIAGNIGQNVDSALSPTSDNPVKNSVIYDALRNTLSTDDITNCITEIPQDIKLELNGGTLILKSGSKFYYPNGLDGTTPIFNSFTTTSDLTLSVGGTEWTNKEHAILVLNDGTSSAGYACPDDLYSGSNPPTLSTQYACWYDTGSNIIRRTTDSGSTWTSTPYSFPICIAVNTGGNCDSISQIFNGFGYVGSTVFVLPGVKGLIPNGRNADGTLKNYMVSIAKVYTRTNLGASYTNNQTAWNIGGFLNYDSGYRYIEKDNVLYPKNANTKRNDMIFAAYSTDANQKITSFTPLRTTFHAVDYSDTEYMAHQAMPSNKYIDLTLGASGTTYTAPADGWFCISKKTNGTNQVVNLINSNSTGGGIRTAVRSPISDDDIYIYLPAKKGDVIASYYSAGGTTEFFRFIYAQGAV